MPFEFFDGHTWRRFSTASDQGVFGAKDCGWAIPQTETHDLDYDDPEAGAVYRAVRIIAKHVIPGARVEQIAVAVPRPPEYIRAERTDQPFAPRMNIRDVHRVTIPRTVPDITTMDQRRVDLGTADAFGPNPTGASFGKGNPFFEPDLDTRARRLRDWFRGGFADGGLSGH